MRLVFAALPAYGHLYPLMPLALAAAEAGHDVTVATGPPFLDRLPLPTIAQQPAELELDSAFDETRRRHPGLEGIDLSVAMFADVAAEAVAGVLLPVLEERRPDLVVYEAMDVGAGIAADVTGIPAVAYAIGLAHVAYSWIHPAAIAYQQGCWTDRGLRPPEDRPFLASALLDPTPPSLRSFSAGLDAVRIPIRSVPYAEAGTSTPAWLSEPRIRPRAYVTLGTVSFGAVDVLRRVLDAVAALDVDVLVAVGPEGDPAALGDVDERVRVEKFVDQAEVLRRVDVIVHHGGTGTVMAALSRGLPQLILPQGADQFANAEFLTRVGAARALRNEDQTPATIRAAVATLLQDGGERAIAQQLCTEIAEMPAPSDVLNDLELIASR